MILADKILVDSSYLYALLNAKSQHHVIALMTLGWHRGRLIIPYVVLTEVAYLFKREGQAMAVIAFLERLHAIQADYEIITEDDFIRVREIMTNYREANLDFVDCCIMAIAERRKIQRIFTFDRRDFTILRPRHVEFFEVLP